MSQKLNPDNERKLWRNWMFLKQELDVPTVTDKLIEAGVYTQAHKESIKNVKPNSKLVRAEKFLNILLERGERGFQAFCQILREDENNKFAEVMEKLEIPAKKEDEVRPNTGSSTSTTATHDSNGERKKRPQVFQYQKSETMASLANDTMKNKRPGTVDTAAAATAGPDSAQAVESVQVAAASMSQDSNNSPVDLTTLERELIKIAPTIADVFQRITKTTNNNPVGVDELNRLKEENERLRKTNRSLIDKLNEFQKQIIQLQLENKRLRDTGTGASQTKIELKKKAQELDELKTKIDQQRKELDEKEQELNEQLKKIQEIETENEKQKLQIMNLEILHEEGVSERNRQQAEIRELREEKEIQKTRIEILEDMQRRDEDRLYKLEERLRMLEQWNSTQSQNTSSSYRYTRERDRRRSSRVMSPPRSHPWMSGVQVNRSHHANVKFQPPPPRGGGGGQGKPTEKGWSF
ncbi:hypothetical protein FSP39_007537 [Pinctada imbricata]|uniref:CARD domain-containing protein n=1 Tax=Pinctada imbricata TaxID=66713 RepID=A0AA88XLF1_PINIB|nr:hypothetical protein FSP39_007537 [Pinctada imbricata]